MNVLRRVFRTATVGLASAIACLTPRPALGVTEVDVQLEAVDSISDYNVAAWWSPVAHHVGDGSIYLTYLKPRPNSNNDDVWVARRDASGQWTRAASGGQSFHDPGHTQSSLAIDGNGRVHLFYGMHGGAIQYRQSNAVNSVTGGFTQQQPPAFAGGDYTYPNLATAPDGDVWMIIRDNPRGRLFHFDRATLQWSSAHSFAGQSGATVYPDQVLAGADGDLHLIWEWAAGPPQASRHYGTYARYDPDTATFYRANGQAYPAGSLPITTATSDVYQPLEGAETFTRDVHGVQSAKMTLDHQNRPVITYSYSTDQTASGYEHRLARWDGTQWLRSTVQPGPFDLDKSWIAFSDGVLRFYGTLSPNDPNHTGSDDIFLRTSLDFGQTWSDPVAITRGFDVQRPVGVTVGGTDYLYLPDLRTNVLHLAQVTIPEPTTTGMVIVTGGALLANRRRLTPLQNPQTTGTPSSATA